MVAPVRLLFQQRVMEAMTAPNVGALAIAADFVLCFFLNGALSAVAHRSSPSVWLDCTRRCRVGGSA
jgi:hypothetical protein